MKRIIVFIIMVTYLLTCSLIVHAETIIGNSRQVQLSAQTFTSVMQRMEERIYNTNSTSTNETEPNDVYSQADIISLDVNINGYISSASDVDWYRVNFGFQGLAHIFLGSIPSSKNYIVTVYESNISNAVATTNTTISTSKLLTIDVDPSNVYYIKVSSLNSHYSQSDGYILIASITPYITVEKINSYIPQNPDSVNVSSISTNPDNACYDYNSAYIPYSGWDIIDYDGTKGTQSDRMLRQVELLITLTDGADPISNKTVTVTTSLGNSSYVSLSNSKTNSYGQVTAYVEYYGSSSCVVTVSADSKIRVYTITNDEIPYRNKFKITCYNYAVRSNFSSQAEFEDAVRLEGTGYDDIEDKWYSLDWDSSTSPLPVVEITSPTTATMTTPTVNRTIAVDNNYIPMKRYVSTGSTSTVFHRGEILLHDSTNISGDTGYRIAEDSGGAINGYHIDVFMGFMTDLESVEWCSSIFDTKNGHYFDVLKYSSTIKGN